jgi:hypothetical protein
MLNNFNLPVDAPFGEYAGASGVLGFEETSNLSYPPPPDPTTIVDYPMGEASRGGFPV